MLLERAVARGADDDDPLRPKEVERDLGAPVERHLRLRGVVAAERDSDDRQAGCTQRFDNCAGQRPVALEGPDVRRRDDCEVSFDVHVVRRDDDRGLHLRGVEATTELLHRLAEHLIEVHVAVRGDRCEDDHEAPGRGKLPATSRSQARSGRRRRRPIIRWADGVTT